MQKKLIVVLIALCAQIPLSVQAGPIVRTGDTVSVDAEQMLKGDFYGFGSDISISGAAENDSYLFGGNVTVNASTTEDLTIVGGMVQVHGEVGDDLRVVGGEVTIAEPIKGDVVVLGGTLSILSTATVEGDVLFYGETLKIDGDVTGSVFGAANEVRINNAVHGDVSLRAYDTLALGDNARIDGSVSYTSAKDLARAQGAEVKGDIHRIKEQIVSNAEMWKTLLMQLFMFAFAVSLMYVLAPRRVAELTLDTSRGFGVHGLIGLSLFLVIPILSVLLFASIIGFVFGIVLILAYLLFLICALLLSPILLGALITRGLKMENQISFATIGIGLTGFFMLALIPYIGGLAIFAVFAIACGKIGHFVYSALRE